MRKHKIKITEAKIWGLIHVASIRFRMKRFFQKKFSPQPTETVDLKTDFLVELHITAQLIRLSVHFLNVKIQLYKP